MQYAPTLTDQKIDSPLKPPTPNDQFFVYRCRGVLHTPHKCPWQWAFESPARYAPIKYVFVESYTRQKFDSPLKPPTRKDPFFAYPCRGVLHTPHKYPWQWANESHTWYVSIKYVLIESYTRQKFDSPLKPPTRNDPFFMYRCRGVLHTPYKYPWQWAIDSSSLYVLGRMQYAPTLTDQKIDSPLKQPTHNDPFFVYPCRGVLHTPNKRPRQGTNESICHPFFEYT